MMNRRITRAFVAATALLAVGAGAVPATAATKANAVDRAFVREMVAHHEMAVDMAKMAEMRADHAQIKTLARAVVRAQTREIKEMTSIARTLGVEPASGDSMDHMQMMKDAETLGLSMDTMGMDMDMSMLGDAKPFDRMFIDMMISHHQGAIRMARAELKKGVNQRLRKVASAIVGAQAKEINQMNAWRKAWYGAKSPSGGVPGGR
jgi:uncharacterized protein (DUF305 family)